VGAASLCYSDASGTVACIGCTSSQKYYTLLPLINSSCHCKVHLGTHCGTCPSIHHIARENYPTEICLVEDMVEKATFSFNLKWKLWNTDMLRTKQLHESAESGTLALHTCALPNGTLIRVVCWRRGVAGHHGICQCALHVLEAAPCSTDCQAKETAAAACSLTTPATRAIAEPGRSASTLKAHINNAIKGPVDGNKITRAWHAGAVTARQDKRPLDLQAQVGASVDSKYEVSAAAWKATPALRHLHASVLALETRQKRSLDRVLCSATADSTQGKRRLCTPNISANESQNKLLLPSNGLANQAVMHSCVSADLGPCIQQASAFEDWIAVSDKNGRLTVWTVAIGAAACSPQRIGQTDLPDSVTGQTGGPPTGLDASCFANAASFPALQAQGGTAGWTVEGTQTCRGEDGGAKGTKVQLQPVAALAFDGLRVCEGLRLFLAPHVGTGESSLHIAVLLCGARCLLVCTPLSGGL
jgi:hypothetical protein